MDDTAIAALQDEVNARIAAEGLEIGPLRIRRMRPALTTGEEPEKDLVVTDGRGRRCATDGDPTVIHVIDSATARHENRTALDEQIATERRVMAKAFGTISRGRIDVLPSGMMDGRRDSFMVFQVTVDLLDDALAWRAHRLRWQPYGKGDGDSPWRFAARQRRRLKALGGGDRHDALRICPVLASRIQSATNPCTWAGMMLSAMDGRETRGLAEFTDGTLHARLDITPGPGRGGATWTRNRLSVPDALPATVASDAVGRRLGDLVAGAHLPLDALVGSVRRKGGRTVVTVDAGTEPLLPVLHDVLERGILPRPELDAFPGRARVISRLRAASRALGARRTVAA